MMTMKHCRALLLPVLLSPAVVQADSIPMTDYIRLKTGMSEAEVLYRVGVYDHETVSTDYYNNIIQKTWYYIPAHSERSNNHWITEIVFDGTGRMIGIDRYRP